MNALTYIIKLFINQVISPCSFAPDWVHSYHRPLPPGMPNLGSQNQGASSKVYFFCHSYEGAGGGKAWITAFAGMTRC